MSEFKRPEARPGRVESTRREFFRASAALGAPALAAQAAGPAQGGPPQNARSRPNILIIIADQLRWDCVGAYGLNPMDLTPNIDSMGRRGVVFQHAVTNQPWCSPSRSCLFTGQYATNTGVWRLGPGLRPGETTLATVLRDRGYSTNYIGKWHLAPHKTRTADGLGWVPPEYRGGFLDLWEGANVIELTSHPYEGDIWNAAGEKLHYSDIYRVDYLTQRAVRFLSQPHEKPFLLVVSQLEPHEQNDLDRPVPPKKYATKYLNPFVPHDLRPYRGIWQDLLPSYYGAIKGIDDSVGVLLNTLSEHGLAENTIVVLLSDHANHFLTRTYAEWKCTPHENSIHIPLVIQGPGFDRSRMIPEVVSIVDVAPTLLDAAGVAVPECMQGRSAMPVVESAAGGKAWRQEAFIQFAASAIGRALRTDQWTYAAIDPNRGGMAAPSSAEYQECQLYNLAADPYQLWNLAGHHETREIAKELRERLRLRIAEAEKAEATISPRPYGLYA